MIIDGIRTTKESVNVDIKPLDAWIGISRLLLKHFNIPTGCDTFEYRVNDKNKIVTYIPEYGHQTDWKESVLIENPTTEQIHLIDNINMYNKIIKGL